MSLFLRTTALMLLVLSRAPAFAALPNAQVMNKIVPLVKTRFVLNYLNTALAACMESNPSTLVQPSLIQISIFFTAKRIKPNSSLKPFVKVPPYSTMLSHISLA